MNWGYIAGFFDGEGHVSHGGMGTNKWSPRVEICQSGERGKTVLSEMGEFLAMKGIRSKVGPASGGTNAPMWALRIHGMENLKQFADGVMPHTKIKKCQLQDILRYGTLYPPLNRGKAHATLMAEICKR